MADDDLAVIGAGTTGLAAARGARSAGRRHSSGVPWAVFTAPDVLFGRGPQPDGQERA